MAEPFQTYRRTVKLPCDDAASGRFQKRELDASVLKVTRKVSASGDRLKCEVENTAGGHVNARLIAGRYIISLQTQFGQNTAFRGGARESFVSYSIWAETRVPSLEKAADRTERLTLIMKIVGGLGGVGLVFGVLNAMMNAFHHAVMEVGIAGLVIVFGAWCGGKLGERIGAALETRAIGQAEEQGVTSEADTVWNILTRELDGVTAPYERA